MMLEFPGSEAIRCQRGQRSAASFPYLKHCYYFTQEPQILRDTASGEGEARLTQDSESNPLP